MSDLDVVGLLGPILPQGPDRSSDTGLTAIGTVYAVDAVAGLVQVGLHGSVLWLPAMPGRYRVRVASGQNPGRARVLINAMTGRPDVVMGAVNPSDPWTPGTLTAINTSTNVATVTVDGSSYSLPYLASTYTVGQSVWVGLSDWGVPSLVLGPSSRAPTSSTAPTAPTSGGTVQVRQTVSPQWSGTWRTGAGWDRWNTTRYGGRSDVYQGAIDGSGTLIGLATYGDQLVNLGATSIDQITLRAYRHPGTPSGSLTVQGSASGTQPAGAPSGSGSTATTPVVGAGSWASVDLPSDVREALRTGADKGLVAVGGTYGGWGGTGTPGSMVMDVLYTRPA